MQVIVYSQENGQVAVCYPTGELPIEELLSRDCPQGAVIVDNDSLPNEHDEFFDAWELNGSTVSINLTKAKEITKTRLRVERVQLLLAQDILFQRAIETSADTSAIVAEKQRLRDITKLVDSATTTDELKSITVGV
jgi:hypothetical protein